MRRKEQNRRAARRFRQNRKLRESVLEEVRVAKGFLWRQHAEKVFFSLILS